MASPRNLSNTRVLLSVGAITLLAILVGIWVSRGGSTANRANPAEATPRQVTDDIESAHSVTDLHARLANVNNVAVPAASSLAEATAEERYRFLSNCAKYARLRSSISRQEEDPTSWINNESAANLLSAEQLASLQENVDFIEDQSSVCSGAPLESAEVLQLYSAALDLSKQGDVSAAHCFLLAPWASAEAGIAKDLQEMYVKNAPGVLDAAIRSGSWATVNLMISTYAGPVHGLRATAFQRNTEYAYGFAKIKELGLAKQNLGQEQQVRRDALVLREELSTEQIMRQDVWAAEAFNRYFEYDGDQMGSVGRCTY